MCGLVWLVVECPAPSRWALMEVLRIPTQEDRRSHIHARRRNLSSITRDKLTGSVNMETLIWRCHL